MLDITNKALYTLINVSLQHVKPAQSDQDSDNTNQTKKATINIPEENKNISQLNNTNHKDSQGKNEPRTESSPKSNSTVIILKNKNSKISSTERWYTVTYQEAEHGENKN